jgi:hypothetical protein
MRQKRPMRITVAADWTLELPRSPHVRDCHTSPQVSETSSTSRTLWKIQIRPLSGVSPGYLRSEWAQFQTRRTGTHTPICCYINAKAVGSQTAIMSDDQYDETLGKLFDRES